MSQTSNRELRRVLNHLFDFDYLAKNTWIVELVRPWLGESDAPTGLAIHDALVQAIEELGANDPAPEMAPERRVYHILHATYVQKLPLPHILQQMGISRAAYFREQSRALDQLEAMLRHRVRETQLALKESESIPRLQRFIGREKDLAIYRKRLQTDRIAFICGMAGVGKTALAAELATECQRTSRVLWISFRQGRNTSLLATLEGLALSMAAQGEPEFWRFLQAGQRADLPPPAVQIRFLVNLLERQPHTLCLDDVHEVAHVPEIERLLLALRDSARQGRLTLILTSRHALNLGDDLSFAPLAGLTRPEMEALLQAAGLDWLPDPLVNRLHQRTQGHPLLLNLFVTCLHNQGLDKRFPPQLNGDGNESVEAYARIQRFIDTLERVPDVRHYLLCDVYETLSPVERQFVHIASAIRLPFDETSPGLLAILAEEGIQNPVGILQGLADKYLVTRSGGQDTILSHFHALVRDYFYSRFKGRVAECVRVHRRLAEYYEHEVDDPLEAAYHSSQAGDYERAADLLAARIDTIHNRGQARQALAQLEAIPHSRFDPPRRLALQVSKGDLCLCIGDFATALRHYRQAVDDPEAVWSPIERVDLWRKMGRACERQGDTHQALAYLQAGQQTLVEAGAQRPSLVAARLYGLMGWIYIQLKGNLASGRHYSTHALAIVEERLAIAQDKQEQVQLRKEQAWLYNSLGVMDAQKGLFRQALEHFSRSLAIRAELQDNYGVAICHSNLGALNLYCGNPQRAIEHSQRSLELAEEMGDLEAIRRGLANLGEGYLQQGEYARAMECARRCLDLARQSSSYHSLGAAHDLLGWASHCLGDYDRAEEHYLAAIQIRREHTQAIDLIALDHARLGQLYLDWDRVELAESHLREALRIFGETGSRWMLPEVYRSLAEVHLAQGESEAAEETARVALELAQSAGHTVYEGEAWRVLGEIEARLQSDRAATSFERCLTLLSDAGRPLTLAQAWRSYGLFLLKTGNKSQGQKLLVLARTAFTKLGAKGEVSKTRRLWHEAQAAPASLLVAAYPNS